MANPPTDITMDILSNLPMKSFIRFKCACKIWHSWISHSEFKPFNQQRTGALVFLNCSSRRKDESRSFLHFINQQLISSEIENSIEEQLRFNPGQFRKKQRKNPIHRYNVLGCCDGLLLVHANEHICLWNPTTNSCNKVHELETLASRDWRATGGLIFDSFKNDYKVLLFICNNRPDKGREYAIVASLKGKEWREISFTYDIRSLSRDDMITIHGRLHFGVRAEKSTYDKVIYFDSVSEKFHPFPIPEPKSERWRALVGLGVLNECFSMTYRDNDYKAIEIWIMKEYGIKESWTSLFVINISEISHFCRLAKPLFMSENAELVLILYEFDKGKIVAYNHKNDSMRDILVPPEKEDIYAITYVKSLVSLKGYYWNDYLHKQFATPRYKLV